MFEASKDQLVWPSGAIARLYSADSPDLLRGPEHDLAWCDELAAWRRADETWANLSLTMRAGVQPRIVVTTTPRPTKLLKDLVAREGRDGVAISRSTTYDNRQNLAPSFFAQLVKKYEGTRTGRQELLAELLTDVPGALWTVQMLEDTRVSAPPALQRIVVAIDPSGSGSEGADECGIVVAGLGQDGEGYVLADLSGRMSPTEWARKAVDAYHVYKADRIVAETNFGGLMVAGTIAAVDPSVPVKQITSSRGKVLRAEPISAFFEQGRAHLTGSFPQLEDQATSFTCDYDRARSGSPDRVDALVFALHELMCNQPVGGFFREAALLVNGAPAELPRFADWVFGIALASDITDSVAVLYCASCQILDLGSPLAVLDWELVEAEEILSDQWLPEVFRKLREFAMRCTRVGAQGRAPLFIEPSPLGQALIELGTILGFDIQAIEYKTLLPELGARAITARGYVSANAVKVCRPAHEKISSHRGLARNHLLAQLTRYDPQAAKPAEAFELVDAFSSAVCLALPGREVSALLPIPHGVPDAAVEGAAAGPSTAREAAAIAAPVPAVPPTPTVLLAPGLHVIDGVATEVPRDRDRDQVPWPLAVGRHILDDRLVLVHPPGGIRVR